MLGETTTAFSDQEIQSYSTVSYLPENRERILINEPGHNWWPDIEERLKHLINLDNGWDGYNAEPVSFLNASFALRVLETICTINTPAPQIVPGTGGDLQIEWHTDTTEIELHVIAPYRVEAWICSPETGTDGKELILTNNFIEVVRALSKMMEHLIDEAAAA